MAVTLYFEGELVSISSSDYPNGGFLEQTTFFGNTDERFANTVFAVAKHGEGLYRGTASDSVAISTGAKTFSATPLRPWFDGAGVKIVDASNSSNWMFGSIISYDASTGALDVSVSSTNGSGTFNDWVIYSAGLQGPQGDPGGLVQSGANLGSTSGTIALDTGSTDIFTVTLTGSSTFQFNSPDSFDSFVLEVTDGGSVSITWPTSVNNGSFSPTLTTSGTDLLGFVTTDGGTNWSGFLIAVNV